MEPIEQLLNELEKCNVANHNALMSVLSRYEISFKETDCGKDMQQKIQMYLSAKRLEGLSQRTLEAYEMQLKLFLRDVQKPAEKVTTSDIRLYLGKNTELSANTICTKLAAIRAFFQWLVDEEFLQRNPASRSKIKPPKVGKRLVKALSIDELLDIRDACSDVREKALVDVLYSTGCRVSEVHDLNISDIDFINKCCRVIGKGDKERIVYFNSKSLKYLNQYLNGRHDSNPALFVTYAKPNERLGVRSIQRAVAKIAGRSDVEKHVHPHTFRHTLGTTMLNNGSPIVEVQGILGHSSPVTTQIYAQLDESKKREAHRRYVVQ